MLTHNSPPEVFSLFPFSDLYCVQGRPTWRKYLPEEASANTLEKEKLSTCLRSHEVARTSTRKLFFFNYQPMSISQLIVSADFQK